MCKKKEKIKKNCEICEEEFIAWNDSSRFCSYSCMGVAKIKEKIKKHCEFCGDEFLLYLSQANRKFCSRKCCTNSTIKERTKRYCKICGKEFEIYECIKDRMCCSSKCAIESRKKDKIKKECKMCGKNFYVIPANKDAKFCSLSCKYKYDSYNRVGIPVSEESKQKISKANKGKLKGRIPWNKQEKIKKKCIICGNDFFVTEYRKDRSKFCSHKCHNIDLRQNPTNKGIPLSEETKKKISDKAKLRLTIHPELSYFIRQQEYYTDEYIDWRMFCLKRDKHKCVLCGKRKELHVHHIIPKTIRRDLEFDTGNGISLCVKCHCKQHPGLENLIASRKNKIKDKKQK